MPRCRKRLVGRRFGKIIVVATAPDYINPNTGRRYPRYVCRCDCGNEQVCQAVNIVKNKHGFSSCAIEGHERSQFLAKGESAKNQLFRDYRRNALAKQKVFLLSRDALVAICGQPCHYCGAPPSKVVCHRKSYGVFPHNGIDRVDNSKGYVIGNCVPCCETCNKMKHTLGQAEFLAQVSRIVRWSLRKRVAATAINQKLLWQ